MTNTRTAPRWVFFLLIALGGSLWATNRAAAETLQQPLQSPIANYAPVFDHPENVVSERRPIAPIISLIGKFLSEKLEFPGPARPPRVEFVSSKQIAIIRYRDLSAEPELLRFSGKPNALDMAYDDANGVIYLSEYWTGGSPAELSVLLHGLVNHTQRENGLTYACSQQREEVAFAAQEAWLKQFGQTLSETFGLDEAAYMLNTQCIP
jgi:uncharacterized protein DUF6647